MTEKNTDNKIEQNISISSFDKASAPFTSSPTQTSSFLYENQTPKTSTSTIQSQQNVDVISLINHFWIEKKNEIISGINSKIDKIDEEINIKVKSIEQELEKQKNKSMDEFKQDIEIEKNTIRESITNSETKLENIRNSVLATLALFASFFTFISVSFSIFSKASLIESIGLMLTLWCCLFSFSYIFFGFLFKKIDSIKFWIPLIFVLILAICSLWWISINQPKTEINFKISTDKPILSDNSNNEKQKSNVEKKDK